MQSQKLPLWQLFLFSCAKQRYLPPSRQPGHSAHIHSGIHGTLRSRHTAPVPGNSAHAGPHGTAYGQSSRHPRTRLKTQGTRYARRTWFPMLEAYLQIESLCKRIGFTAEQISVLLAGKALNFSGSLYSEKHRRKFNVENAEIKVFSDSTKPNQLFLCINRQPIVEWFKEQWNISKDRRTLNPKINKEEKI